MMDMEARALRRKGPWAPKAVRCREDLEGGDKVGQRLIEQG